MFIYKASPSKISNALSVIFVFEPLNGSNCLYWRKKIDMTLTLTKIDYTFDNLKSVGHILPIEGTPKTINNASLTSSYDLECFKRDR